MEEHRKKGGELDIDVAFQWLYMFFEPDDEKLADIVGAYTSGYMLTGDMKAILIQKLIAFLGEHRRLREKARGKVHEYEKDGTLAQDMWKRDFSKS